MTERFNVVGRAAGQAVRPCARRGRRCSTAGPRGSATSASRRRCTAGCSSSPSAWSARSARRPIYGVGALPRGRRQHHQRHARRPGRAGHPGVPAADRPDQRPRRPDDGDGQLRAGLRGARRAGGHRRPARRRRPGRTRRAGSSSTTCGSATRPRADGDRRLARSAAAPSAAPIPTTTCSPDVSLDDRARARRWRWSGASGSGKTTLASLIPRLYDVTGGAVRVDGHDVRDLTQESLRAAIGVVSQDPHLFHDTIGANLRYAKPDATRGRARRGLPRRAHLRHDRRAARRLRHRGRRARLPAERRREAAPGHRPAAAEEPGDHDPRRGHQPPRQRERGARAGRARRMRCGAAPPSSSPTGCRPSATPTASWCSTTAAIVEEGTHDELMALDGLYAAQVQAGESSTSSS